MPVSTHPASILVPMLIVIALTFVAFIRMGMLRRAAINAGQDPRYYKAQIGSPEPEATVVAVRHYSNLLELPTIFYAGCLTAFVLPAVTGWTLLFAWIFVAARLVQSVIHLSYNDPTHRGLSFVIGALALVALWSNLALAIVARL